ncbi:MAG: chemotaxis protein CheW [Aggregatilineales bacterium]
MVTSAPTPEATLLPFLTFRLGQQSYALPIAQVIEVAAMVELVTVANAPAALLGVANRHGSVLPVLDLRLVFGQPAPPVTDSTLFVVAAAGARQAGLVVDEVYQVAYFDAQQLAASPVSEKYVEGILTHRDQLIQIVALPALLASFLPEGAAEHGCSESQGAP